MKQRVHALLLGPGLVLAVLFAGPAWANTEYVTDRIELGVHQAPGTDSVVLATLASGTAVVVLAQRDGFKQIRLPNGTQGWVSAGYLVSTPPAAVAYDALAVKHNTTLEELKEARERLTRTERDLQIRRDELSNANTTIRELRRQLEAGGIGELDEETLQRLAEKEQEISQLKAQIVQLQQDNTPEVPPDLAHYQQILHEQSQFTDELKLRIDLALAHLTGDRLPSPEELELWRPPLPTWYWGIMLFVLLIGIVGGIGWMDYRLRRRHGGFRI